MAYLDQFLQAIVAAGASDLHIGEGQPPKMRQHAMSWRCARPVLRDEAVLMQAKSPVRQLKIFDKRVSILPTKWMPRRAWLFQIFKAIEWV
jgi:Tfp pilus assembly pilus retraction ATPase PilT